MIGAVRRFLAGVFASIIVLVFPVGAEVLVSPSEQCLSFMEKYKGITSTYKFLKSNSALGFEIVEIPHSVGVGYITYFTEKGYAEINSASGACNSSRDNKSIGKNAQNKLLEIFTLVEAHQKVIQAENDVTRANLGSKAPRDIDNLVQFRKVCADSFPDIAKYLEKNGTLQATKAPRAGCPGTASGEQCPPLK